MNVFNYISTCSVTFEANDRLIETVLWMWVVILPALGPHVVDNWENFLKIVVPRLTPRRQVGVVNEV